MWLYWFGCNTSDWIHRKLSLYRGTISPCSAPESCVDFTNLRFWDISPLWDQREKYEVLGYQKFWYHEYILIIRGSEILNTFLYCLWDQKSWIFCVVWGIRNSESPVCFLGSEILNPPLCCLGDQKFWISCVVLGSEILNPLLCYLEDQKLWILSCVIGGSEIRIPLLCCLGDQKFWMLSCILVGDKI